MGAVERTSWNKIIVICSTIGIPLVSVLCWLIVQGTHVVDDVHSIVIHQTEQDLNFATFKNEIKDELKGIHKQVDTLILHQTVSQFIYQKQPVYNSPVLKHYIQRWVLVNGKYVKIEIPIN